MRILETKKIICDQRFGEERALYAANNVEIKNCAFAGQEDGESALKEASNLSIENCDFLLRYPLWHADDVKMSDCRMTETCRAALWYDNRVEIENTSMGGIKALRECHDVTIKNSTAVSTEYGWFCGNINIDGFELTGEYPFMHTSGMEVNNFTLHGKYSFQYVENVTIRNSNLDTKDSFWHSKNVTVYDSVVKGEYLAWYSENLRLVRCKIIGTQPLCYCKGLILEDCEMEGCDLSFENSDVQATVKGHMDSVKNPVNGFITADEIGEVILDEYRWQGDCAITVGGNKII
ncbi:MAG: DUF3737 family protein [Clostridia bacterium]|nr:DUF3737 family protein [Clostridia bacterium]